MASRQDHPRLHGGTYPRAIWDNSFLGPSPPTRGNRRGNLAPCSRTGTIPAYTGEPLAKSVAQVVSRDHPRLHGGTRDITPANPLDKGPSPPTRGNPRHHPGKPAGQGTIPAYTGEPPSRVWKMPLSRDHPRLHGGTSQLEILAANTTGPSPPTRGNHHERGEPSV